MTTTLDEPGTTTTPVTTARVRLRPGTELAAGAPLRVGRTGGGWLPVPRATDGLRALLGAAQDGPATEDELAALVVGHDGEAGLMGMHLLLARLAGAGLLEHEVAVDGAVLGRLTVVGQGPTTLRGRLDPAAAVVLSRFATVTVAAGLLHVRAPRSALAVELAPAAAAVLGAVSSAGTPDEVADRLDGLPAAATALLLRLLTTAGTLDTGAAADQADPADQWDPADLWLHARSRGPRTVAGYGGTYHGRGRREPEPAVPAARGGRTLALPVPDLAAVAAADPSFTAVLEGRRSLRVQDPASPITAAQLGELLYRSVRLRRSAEGSDGEQVADRPYPSGGAAHELEIYPLVTACDGVEPGLWHYRTDTHVLELVAEPDRLTAGLLARARASAVMETDPQVVLLVTARFGRVMFKYESIAYSLVLKHVGVLYQTLYLVATAMDLAICGLGGGDAELFATATGRDYLTEGTVGELVLGSRGAGVAESRWSGEEPPS